MNRILNISRSRKLAGFSLIEVLVAIVIFSIGLLGIASLQIAGLRFASGSQHRAVATMQAQNIADRMLANLGGVENEYYNITGSMPGSYTTDCSTADCNPTDLATYDLVTWNLENADLLPSGDGIVCLDWSPNDGDSSNWACDNSGDVYAIKIEWQERIAGDEDIEDAAGEGVQTRQLVMTFVPL
ncbi:MAG: type IV pilus modification protein PilV [Gammaproteobacteria bacterium]|nr:type IV pilus modification protein PilV [Gammaproteobacteria bacterium]